MFINKIYNWQKTEQIIDRIKQQGQISDDQVLLFKKYAQGNAIDDQLNHIDINSCDYGYLPQFIKIYKDISLSKQIQQQIELQTHVCGNNQKQLYHTTDCKWLSIDDPSLCICKSLPVYNSNFLKDIQYQQRVFEQIQNPNINLSDLINTIIQEGHNDQTLREQQISKKIGEVTTINVIPNPGIMYDLIQMVCNNCSNNYDFGNIPRKRGQFQGITLDQYKMLKLIYLNYQKNVINQSSGLKATPNLYLLDSPTGTGKTENFILSQYLTKFLYNMCQHNNDGTNIHLKSGINTIIFSNNELVALQTLERFSDYLNTEDITDQNKTISKQRVNRIEIILDKKNKPILILTHNEVSQQGINLIHEPVYDLLLSFGTKEDFVFKQQEIFNKLIENQATMIFEIKMNYQYQYICNTRYQYADKLSGYIWNYEQDQLQQADYCLQDLFQNIFDIIIIPLYNYQFLNMFGILNPQQNVQTVVYDELDVFYQKDRIEEFHKFFFSQLYNLTAKSVIFASATLQVEFIDKIDYNFSQTSQAMIQRQIFNNVTNAGIIERFPVILTNGAKVTVTTMEGFKDILQKSWQAGNNYIYFDLESATNIFASYAVIKSGSITIKTPDSMSKLKGPDLETRLVSKLIKYKHLFITNRILRNNYFFTEQPIIRSLESNISLLKAVPLLRMVEQKNIEFDSQNPSMNNLKTYMDQMLQKYLAQPLNIQDPIKTLIITVSDDYITKYLKQMQNDKIAPFSQEAEQQTIDIYKEFAKLKYYKLKLQTPFSQQLVSNIRDSVMVKAEKNIIVMYDDFNKIGRGIDIDGLRQVILIIPLHYQLDQFGFSQSEFTQILGRVGRFRKVGDVTIITIDIKHNFTNQINDQELKDYIQDGFRQKIENISQEEFDKLKENNKQLIEGWLNEAKQGQLSIKQISNELSRIK